MLLICLLPLLLLGEVPHTSAQHLVKHQLSAKHQLFDYQCQQPNGYEAVSHQCDLYVECQDNKAYQESCPDGLHFNHRAQWPNYPCGYPSEVKCGALDAIQEARATSECSHRFGFFRMPSGDCGSYMECYEGVAKAMKCPPGLVFNSVKAICDWPSNVPDCAQPSVFEGFECPAAPPGEEGLVGNYRYGNSCRHFLACVDDIPRLLQCDAGLSFDENSQSCQDAKLVLDCDPNI